MIRGKVEGEYETIKKDLLRNLQEYHQGRQVMECVANPQHFRICRIPMR